MNFEFHTFGCKVNTYDTGLIQKNLSLLARADGPKIHVLNTCAVTAEATKEARKMVRRIKAANTEATVVVTGCAAQVDTQQFIDESGADLVVANSHKGLLPQIIEQYFKGTLHERVFKSNIFRNEELGLGGGEEASHTRSFLKIQDGCNSFCTFCIIPYARGKSRSLPVEYLVKKMMQLEATGVQEIVLTGVHIGDYEYEEARLEDLLASVLQRTKIPRIRLTSLEPIEISERLLDLYQDDRLCPHFHMSIQSADTEVLKQMKRQYTEEQVVESLKELRKRVPGCFIGMDVIAGFPTESEAQFENTYKNLSESPWTRLHVFPYSERPGTLAASLPQVALSERKHRASQLRSLSLHRYQSEALLQKGQIKKVLVLKKERQGLSSDYWSVKANFTESMINQEVSVLIHGFSLNEQRQEGVLEGVLL